MADTGTQTARGEAIMTPNDGGRLGNDGGARTILFGAKTGTYKMIRRQMFGVQRSGSEESRGLIQFPDIGRGSNAERVVGVICSRDGAMIKARSKNDADSIIAGLDALLNSSGMITEAV